MEMNVNGVDRAVSDAGAGVGASPAMRDACAQFEGLLVGMILKESLRDSFPAPDEESNGGMDGFRDFCIEQVSAALATTSSLGIADQLTESAGVHTMKRGLK